MQDLLPTTDALAELRRNPSPFRERMDRRSAAGRLTFLHGSLSSSCCPICAIRRGQRLKVSVPSFRFRVLNRWPERATKPLHSWRGGITRTFLSATTASLVPTCGLTFPNDSINGAE